MTVPSYLTEFTFQREWVERRGIFLLLAFFLGGLGGGLYLVSLYLHLHIGLVVGLLIVLIGKGGTHLIYLGKPMRFWRGFLRLQTSWIARGLVAVAAFVVFGALQLAPTLPQLSWLPWTADNRAILVLVILAAVALITYTGFALGVVKAIPFWNTALMPVLFMACSLLGGCGLALLIIILTGASPTNLAMVENIVRWLLPILALLLGIYVWVSYYGSVASRKSVLELVKGRISPHFLVGVVVIGIILPLSIAVVGFFQEISPAVLVIGILGELIGGFLTRYSILKAGAYTPLV